MYLPEILHKAQKLKTLSGYERTSQLNPPIGEHPEFYLTQQEAFIAAGYVNKSSNVLFLFYRDDLPSLCRQQAVRCVAERKATCRRVAPALQYIAW
ncbi:MAG TPA: hypothetical protein VMW40_04235 [Candidatus Bathyarchaeia archaeon]|nr:hypothetical protein [Candidatus Bathyarchaeia archaeon]